MGGQGSESSKSETGPIGLIAAVMGLPTAVIWLFWTNFYLRFMEGYITNTILFATFLPYMLPYIDSSLFLTIYVVVQLVLYQASKELMIILWYGGLVVATLIFGAVDIVQIALRKTGGRPILSVAFGATGIALTILMLIGPQIAFYTFLVRLPLYAASAILLRGQTTA